MYEIVDARTQYPLQSAELLQQLAALDRTQARNGFEYRLTVPFRPLAPVSGDRKAMRLVAHALDQVQGAANPAAGSSGVSRPNEEQLLLPGAPVGALGDADQRDAEDAELREHLGRLRELPLAAVDQQDVGRARSRRRARACSAA